MKRVRPIAQCAGKHAFASFALAKAVNGRRNGSSMAVYHCPTCGLYHLGHDRSSVGRTIVKRRRDKAARYLADD